MTLPADTTAAVPPSPAAATPAAEASPPSGSGPRDGGIDSPRAAPSSWIDGLDADHRRVAELKGWKSPGDAVKGYAHLERTLGADKLALGADGNRDFAQWDGWAQLGRPDKADDYQFANTNDPLAAAMRPALHAAALAQWQVDKISGAFTEHAKGIEAAAQKAAADDRAALEREWGSSFDKQLTLANGALKLLFGEDIEDAKRIQLADGKFLLDDARLARGLARIGELVAEDGDLGAGAPKPEMPRTSAEAQAEINAVRAAAYENPKHAYNDQRHPEHEALHARVRDLYRIAQGDAR